MAHDESVTVFLALLALAGFVTGMFVIYRREPAAQDTVREARELVAESYGALRRRELDFTSDEDIDDVSLGEFLVNAESK